jgi:hypothetical protein
MKYRSHKIKCQHTMIKGLQEFLGGLGECESIKVMIPAKIFVKKHQTSKFEFKVTREVPDGLKCLAVSGSAVQEVFIVCNNMEEVTAKILKQLAVTNY